MGSLSQLFARPGGQAYWEQASLYLLPILWRATHFYLWQRTLVSALSLILAYGFPAFLGVRGIMTLLFIGLLCCYPALILTIILIFKTIPPKYVRKGEAVRLCSAIGFDGAGGLEAKRGTNWVAHASGLRVGLLIVLFPVFIR